MKNLKNVLKVLLGLGLSSFIIGCGTVTLKDQIYCGDAGPLGASCFHTQSDETFDLTKEEWDVERFGQVCSSAEAYSENVAALEKACRYCRCCSYDNKLKIVRFKKNLNDFKQRINQLNE